MSMENWITHQRLAALDVCGCDNTTLLLVTASDDLFPSRLKEKKKLE